jgi:hypothetical protein
LQTIQNSDAHSSTCKVDENGAGCTCSSLQKEQEDGEYKKEKDINEEKAAQASSA